MTILGDRVAIVGAGQMGTALGRALRDPGSGRPVPEVVLYDLDPGAAAASLALGAGDRVLDHAALVQEAQTVIVALPVAAILLWLEQFGGQLRPGTLLLDTGSAKVAVVEAMARLVPARVHAVGGHPIAGTEVPGAAGGAGSLLTDATFALTPVRPDPAALEGGLEVAAACRARGLVLSAQEHDRLVARTSHLPHLLASAAAAVAARADQDLDLVRALAGPGFASTTRLSASDPAMVAAFASSNRRQLEQALEEFRDELA
ncbi:MAG TPA: prephenate dehydrogenase, partial [Candidatus Dormibacteraeota bacterium]